MTTNSPSSMNSSSKSSSPLNPATAPLKLPPQSIEASLVLLAVHLKKHPKTTPKRLLETDSVWCQSEVMPPPSLPPTTVHHRLPLPKLQIPAKFPHPQKNQPTTSTKWGTKTARTANHRSQSTHSLLQRINALEIYVAAQDQRIHRLEAIIEQSNFPHQPREADPIIREIQEKLRTIEATPIASYRDIAAKGIPNLASAVIKEQTERLKRSKSIIIRDNNEGSNAISQSPATLLQDISTWLGTHGLTPDDTAGLSARLIPRKPNLSTHTAASPPVGATIIVTLPSITDRLPIIAKLKRSVRSTPSCNSIYVDPDLTPAEAKAQQALRQERNRLNAARMDEDITTYHFGIRSGRVVKLQH